VRDAGRVDEAAVVPGELGVAVVEARVVEIGLEDAAAQVVGLMCPTALCARGPGIEPELTACRPQMAT